MCPWFFEASTLSQARPADPPGRDRRSIQSLKKQVPHQDIVITPRPHRGMGALMERDDARQEQNEKHHHKTTPCTDAGFRTPARQHQAGPAQDRGDEQPQNASCKQRSHQNHSHAVLLSLRVRLKRSCHRGRAAITGLELKIRKIVETERPEWVSWPPQLNVSYPHQIVNCPIFCGPWVDSPQRDWHCQGYFRSGWKPGKKRSGGQALGIRAGSLRALMPPPDQRPATP